MAAKAESTLHQLVREGLGKIKNLSWQMVMYRLLHIKIALETSNMEICLEEITLQKCFGKVHRSSSDLERDTVTVRRSMDIVDAEKTTRTKPWKSGCVASLLMRYCQLVKGEEFWFKTPNGNESPEEVIVLTGDSVRLKILSGFSSKNMNATFCAEEYLGMQRRKKRIQLLTGKQNYLKHGMCVECSNK